MLENKLFADLNTVDEKELLQFVLKNDILNLDDVKEAMRKKQKEEILRKHPYSIWQGRMVVGELIFLTLHRNQVESWW